MNILLIEDSEPSQALIGKAIEKAGLDYQLNIVETGEEALSFLQESTLEANPSVDMVLLDLNLPKKSGIEVLSDIRSDEKFNNVPIIILTSSNMPSDIQACSGYYRCRYFLKPSRFHELVEFVKHMKDYC